MIDDLMTLAERVAELEARLNACAPSDLEAIFAIRMEILEICVLIEKGNGK